MSQTTPHAPVEDFTSHFVDADGSKRQSNRTFVTSPETTPHVRRACREAIMLAARVVWLRLASAIPPDR